MGRIFILLLLSTLTNAATLKPESVEAWDRYVTAAKDNLAKRTHLWVDESAERRRRVRDGEIVVEETYSGPSKKAAGALIHDWTGAAFIPGAKVEDVIAVVRSYGRYAEYYPPTVIRSETVERSKDIDRFSVLMMNLSLLRTAIETDCQATYTQVSDKRWYAISTTTRIQEVEDYGRPGEHRLPVGEGGGYIWRLASLTRFEERDGGVYLEVEALALSRDVPGSLRFVVGPIVRRVSRNSLTESLRQTGRAVTAVVAANERNYAVARSKPASILGIVLTNR